MLLLYILHAVLIIRNVGHCRQVEDQVSAWHSGQRGQNTKAPISLHNHNLITILSLLSLSFIFYLFYLFIVFYLLFLTEIYLWRVRTK